MEFRDFLRAIGRSWAIVVVAAALALILASAYTLMVKPVYQSDTEALVATDAGTSASDLSQGAQFAQAAVKTFVSVATSGYVLDRVIQDLGLHESVGQLRQGISVNAPVDTSLLDITVSDTNPRRAAQIANSVVKNLSIAAPQLTLTSADSGAVRITQIEPAAVPTRPSSPDVPLNLGIGLLLGLIIGVGIALLRRQLDTRVRTEDDAAAAALTPVLGSIPFDPGTPRRPIIAAGGDDSLKAEAFRTLRTNLQFLDYAARTRSMTVTSSVSGEGKTVTAANLAVVMAETGRRVVIVDGDLRRPQLASYMGLDGRVGVTDVLIGATDLDRALQRWGDNRLAVLPAGSIPPNPSELLQSVAMAELIAALESRFDVVLIDAPPLIAVSDAAILARSSGGALLVTASGVARKPELQKAAAQLRQVDARVLGTVLTLVPVSRSTAHSYERLQPAQVTSRTPSETDSALTRS